MVKFGFSILILKNPVKALSSPLANRNIIFHLCVHIYQGVYSLYILSEQFQVVCTCKKRRQCHGILNCDDYTLLVSYVNLIAYMWATCVEEMKKTEYHKVRYFPYFDT